MYYDGSHNDARMNISLAITSARHGANVANHVSVTDLVKNEEGKLIGAKMKDHITGQEWTTKAKSIINATGPFTDAIRKMDNQVSFSLNIFLSNAVGNMFQYPVASDTVVHVTIRVGTLSIWCQPYVIHVKRLLRVHT